MFTLRKNPAPVVVTLIEANGDRPTVTVTFPPQPTPLSLRAARRAVLEQLRVGGPLAEELAADAFTSTLIRHNILSWAGIGDENEELLEPTHDVEIRDIDGNVTEIEPGTISAFLTEPRFVERCDQEWVLPWAMADAEKNGLSLSPNGTSAGAMPEAGTANLFATPGEPAAAETMPVDPHAPTSGTRRKRTKVKRPGSSSRASGRSCASSPSAGLTARPPGPSGSTSPRSC